MLKVLHNAKYDLNVLARNGIHVDPIDDTMVISFALDAGRAETGIGGGHGMDELAERHLGHKCLTFKEVCGTGKKAINVQMIVGPSGPVGTATGKKHRVEFGFLAWLMALLK